MKKGLLEINEKGFSLNGEPFYLASGDIHYFRLHPSAWKRHLLLAKEFGLTAVQTYVPWNLHEPKKGRFDFSGHLDLCAFLREADELGLKVLLRPAPYICSECDFGALPAWLYRNGDIDIRCSDPAYLADVSDYYDVLIPKLLPWLSTNGGPVIMVAVENEYGGSGNDMSYLRFLIDKLKALGVDVPLYTTDNSFPALRMCSQEGLLAGANFRSYPEEPDRFADMLEKLRPGFPFFVGELWSGHATYWGESTYLHRDPAETALAYENALKRGFVDFYMFSGGTNFGFFSGACIGRGFSEGPGESRYLAHVTSYDEDSLVTENGLPTEKYWLCREKLDAARGLPVRKDRSLPFTYETQELDIALTETAPLFENIEALTEKCVRSAGLRTMEQLGQSFGYLLYTNDIETYPDAQADVLTLNGVHDRATVYTDGVYRGTVTRDADESPIGITLSEKHTRLDILVENMARVNTGKYLDKDRKGITGYVLLNLAKLYGWTERCLPMDDLSVLRYRPLDRKTDFSHAPAFFRGHFDAKPGTDSFLDMRGFTRGFVVVNGFNLGRYFNIGPQFSLYLPGGLLKASDNVIEIFDSEHCGKADSLRGAGAAIYS